jgi:hypothetical protein
MMDRRDFLVLSGVAPLVPAAKSLNLADLRVLVTVGRANRVAVLACCSTFAIVSGSGAVTRTVNIPRPDSAEPGWNERPPPAVPITNPAFRNDDVVFDAVPDDVTASLVYKTGVVFALKPRVGAAYLVYVVPDRVELLVFGLRLARPVQALFLAPDGLHVVFGAEAQTTIVPPDRR